MWTLIRFINKNMNSISQVMFKYSCQHSNQVSYNFLICSLQKKIDKTLSVNFNGIILPD